MQEKKSQEESAPPLLRKDRVIVKAKSRFGNKADMPVRDLWKEKLRSHMEDKMMKQKEEVKSLESAFENLAMSSQPKKFRYQGGYYKVHTGEKGGKYILVNGEKKYLRRNHT
jgi:hypothetical protein